MNFNTKRQEMVDDIRSLYGLDSPKVFSAMLSVPREKFVSKKEGNVVYEDKPVDIGYGQTMSQPYTVAFMTHLLLEADEPHFAEASRGKKVLEIGTGSGYQAAVLSKLVKEVLTIEVIPQLANTARKTLKKLGYKNVFVRCGSGEYGWEEKAPFDAILVTAGIEGKVPQALFDQLKVGGVLVAPVGKGRDKTMTKYVKKSKAKCKKSKHGIFHFVPFVEK